MWASGPSRLPVTPRIGNPRSRVRATASRVREEPSRIGDGDEDVARLEEGGLVTGELDSGHHLRADTRPAPQRGEHAPRREETVARAREDEPSGVLQPRLGEGSVEPVVDRRDKGSVVEEGRERLATVAGEAAVRSRVAGIVAHPGRASSSVRTAGVEGGAGGSRVPAARSSARARGSREESDSLAGGEHHHVRAARAGRPSVVLAGMPHGSAGAGTLDPVSRRVHGATRSWWTLGEYRGTGAAERNRLPCRRGRPRRKTDDG